MSGQRFTKSERNYVKRSRRAFQAAQRAEQEAYSAHLALSPGQSRLEAQIRLLGR